MTITTT